MRNLQKHFEKLLILLEYKLDSDPVFLRRITLATFAIIGLMATICSYYTVYAACWLAVNEPEIFSLFWAVAIPLFFGWIWYTEKR